MNLEQEEELLSGRLCDFDLDTLIQVSSLGRTPMDLEVFSADGLAVVGRVTLQAGKVLEATAGDLSGTDALDRLLSEDGQARFRVRKSSRPPPPLE